MTATALAVDLGSSSGRVIAGVLANGRITETEVHRFPHTATMRDGYLSWDLDLIRQEMIKGLRLAVEQFPRATSVSIDTWGVDWVALGASGEPLTPGRCYRDERTNRTLAAFRERLPDERAWRPPPSTPRTSCSPTSARNPKRRRAPSRFCSCPTGSPTS